MDWQAAININRKALLRIIAVLIAMTAPNREARNMILRVLRPAESAARRLIVIAARGLVVTLNTGKTPLPDFTKLPRGTDKKHPAFKLFDARKKFDLGNPKKPKHTRTFTPRISVIGGPSPVFVPSAPGISHSTSLPARLKTLQDALNDLPKQAKRLARQMVKRKAAPAGPRRVPPLRPGLPPGYRIRPAHEVDKVLKECHALTLQLLAAADTS